MTMIYHSNLTGLKVSVYMTGWIKLHRKLLDSPIFQNEKLFKVFAYCLMKASHKDHTQLVGRRVVELEKGQFVQEKASKRRVTSQRI